MVLQCKQAAGVVYDDYTKPFKARTIAVIPARETTTTNTLDMHSIDSSHLFAPLESAPAEN